MKRNWIKRLIGGMSLTSVLFAFQACYNTPVAYGTPPDIYKDCYVEGNVISKTTGKPLPDIKVSAAYSQQYVKTNQDGYFSFYLEYRELYKFRFEDTDSLLNGHYAQFDTIVKHHPDSGRIFLDIEMKEKK